MISDFILMKKREIADEYILLEFPARSNMMMVQTHFTAELFSLCPFIHGRQTTCLYSCSTLQKD